MDSTMELVEVDPGTLVVGANVRLDPQVDKTFVASIRERGVLEPLVCYRDDEGRLVVLHGQRRTLAAVQARRERVPVVVVDEPADHHRIVDQVTENDHRTPLSTVERVAAYEQLAALGLTAAQIAKRTATKRADVDAGLTVAVSPTARQAVTTDPDLTLVQAAAVAEFEGDHEAVSSLLAAAERGHFDHRLQTLRDQRVEDEARAAVAEQLFDAGVAVIQQPSWSSGIKRLADLLQDGQPLDEAGHADCPGHAAYLEEAWDDETEPDDDGDFGPPSWMPVYVCMNPKGNGHTFKAGVLDPDQSRLDANAQARAKDAEAASTERREVIAMNKAWDSSETVRRNWLANLAARKTPPKDAARFIAEVLADAPYALADGITRGFRLPNQLLGVDEPAGYGPDQNKGIRDALEGANDARALLLCLVVVLGALEQATGRHCWRPAAANATTTTRYLRYLQSLGYRLSEVEERACAQSN